MRELLTLIVIFLLFLAAYSLRQALGGGVITAIGFVSFILFAILWNFIDSK